MLALIPLLPFSGFLVNAFFGRRLPKSVSGGMACAAMVAAFGVSLASAWSVMSHHAPIDQTLFTWITSGDLQVPLAFRLDNLSSLMIFVITGIGSLIHIYSTGYMHEESDSEYARYFSYLNLFAAFMLVLVLGSSFPVMFVGWEGVGLCSYLLIGFWFRKKSAADAGKKAFVVNRIGDFGFILGMLLIFTTFGTLDFQQVAAAASSYGRETAGIGVLTAATLLLFLGATGKSAQIPLHVWLPDAMEGPTPVSALIHAATMVTAGVYMIGRNAELFSHAPITLAVVAGIGTATALMAGTIGLVQNDIKRVLAYSTVSQLGYMFLAMGVGAYAAGIFHLYTHAFFKALLFLGSGAVIHALAGEQDLRNMGGLKKHLPITYWTFLIGALAISGVPFLSGFFSKDEILWKTYSADWPTFHFVLYVIGLITALLTATYMFRLVFMAFHGDRRHAAPHDAGTSGVSPSHRSTSHVSTPHGTSHNPSHGTSHNPSHVSTSHVSTSHAGHSTSHVHDAPPSMAFALIVLAIGSIAAGYVGVPHAVGGSNRIETFLHESFVPPAAPREAAAPVQGEHPATAEHAAPVEGGHAADTSTELMLMGLSTGLAFAGIGIAMYFWLRPSTGSGRPQSADGRDAATAMPQRVGGIHRLLLNKYYVDELYDAAIVRPIRMVSTGLLWKGIDAGGIDVAVNGVGLTVRSSSSLLRRLQTGSIRAYAASLFLGVVLILGYYLYR
ncbi:MAG: NADH-quinone oxidoreductase subunit L [Acidobacteria bacterium]|nr:NADH-quinone oxidoreductase subunit L [Acidobacteriota bacterium]